MKHSSNPTHKKEVQQIAKAQDHPVVQPKIGGLYPDLIALQRTIGNQAVEHLLQAKFKAHLPNDRQKGLGLQTKLKISEPGDLYEQEADRIAAQVMTKPAQPTACSAPPCIQRFSGEASGRIDAVPDSVHQTLASPGRPLSPALQQDMEQRFGHDFSGVRVHSGAVAEQSAREVSAHAYTVGHNMVFGAGRFVPQTQEGRRLIAHELAHVVQQTGTETIRGRQGNEKRRVSPVSALHTPIIGTGLAIARKPRAGEIGAAPTVVKPMAREEARTVLATYLVAASLDETLAAMNAIEVTLRMPFTLENAGERLRLLTAAFSLLDASGAAGVLKALTKPIGPVQEHLHKRFLRLDSDFRAPLLDILRERAAAKATPEAEPPGKPPAAASSTAKPTWIELHPGVFALVPGAGTTLDAVAAYVTGNPDVPTALARLNKRSRTTPIEAGQSIIIPVEFIQRRKAFQEMSEPMRRDIVSTQVAKAENQARERFAQVRTPNLPGPGIGGSLLGSLLLTASIIERIVDALIGVIEKAEYAIAFAAGVVHGFLKSIWDAVSDIAKLIYEVLKSIFSLDLVSDLEKLVGSLKNLSLDQIKQMLGSWAAEWAEKLHSKDPWTAGHAHGYLTGYVMAEAAMLLLTGGAAKAPIWISKLGKLVKASRAFATLESAITKAAKVHRAAGAAFDKAVDALRQSRLGKIGKAAEATGSAIAWTAENVKKVLALPSDIAVYVVDKAVANAKLLGPFFKRIGALTKPAKEWLFGCHSPCKWDPDTVADTMRRLPNNKQIEDAAMLAARAPTPPVAKPGRRKVVPSPEPKPPDAPAAAKKPELPEITKQPHEPGYGREVEARARAENMQAWRGKETDVAFARHEQNFNSLVQTLLNKQETLVNKGQGHLLPEVNAEILRMPVDDFIWGWGSDNLKRRWTELRDHVRSGDASPQLAKQFEEAFGQGAKGMGLKNVGTRRPDVVEFFLDTGEILIKDFTTDILNPVHQFKTMFYREVMERVVGPTGPRVLARDINPVTKVEVPL